MVVTEECPLYPPRIFSDCVRDNQPKHRQLRRRGHGLARKKASRAGIPVVLILCEGRETEPNYIRGLCDAIGVNHANVVIIPGDERTDAHGLVRKAQRRFDRDRDYDAVYVVCDCAGEDLSEARALAAKPMRNTEGQFVSVTLIVSRPSIELWLLLHFEYLARPLTPAEATQLLRGQLTDYEKADRRIFAKVEGGLERAIANAERLRTDLGQVGVESPGTDMPILVAAIKQLRRRPPT